MKRILTILLALVARCWQPAYAQTPTIPTDACAEQSQARFQLGQVRSGIEKRDSQP